MWGEKDLKGDKSIVIAVLLVVILGLIFVIGFNSAGSTGTSKANKHSKTFQLACFLYKKDIYVRQLSGNPPYNCYMQCPNTKTVSYCPEEMYIQAVIMERAKKLLDINRLNNDLEQELYLIGDGARAMYRYLRQGDINIAREMSIGSLTTAHFVFNYGVEYNVLQEFLKTRDPAVLDNLEHALTLSR